MPPELLTLFDLFTLDPTHVASAPPTAVSTATYLSGYRIPGTGRGLAAGWKNRAADNVEAIRLARDLATAGAIADAEQMQLLAKYAGFGATDLAQALFPIGDTPVRAGWESIAEQLHKLVTPRDRKWMASSTQYAHYTPVDIMRAIWAAIERLGFTGGRVLEPGCGTGLFIAAAPPALDGALDWTGVELDPTTAMIAKALQPDATIIVGDFAKTKSRSAYDLAIGNPPFATTTIIGEGHAGRLGLRLHDYFIARSLELVRPGGLAAFVTSHGTLDKGATKARDYMASLAELIGAVRLPQGAMREEAGTDVVVDILFFRRSESPVNGDTWRDLIEVSPADGPGEKPMFVNRYYAEHPEMVLGAHAWTSSPFGPVYTCQSPIAHSCSAALRAALDTLPDLAPAATTPIVAAPAAPATPPTPIAIVPDPLTLAIAPPAAIAPTSMLFALPDAPAATPSTTTPKPVLRAITARLSAAERALDAAAYPPKEGSYIVNRHDQLCQYNDAHLDIIPVKADRLVPGMPAKTVRLIRAYIDIRNALRAVITAQAEDLPWDAAQTRLLKAYRAFVEDFGPINLTKTYHRVDPKTGDEFPTHRRPNISAFDEDPDCWLVASAERYDTETDTAQPGPIFTDRVVRPPAEPVIATAEDALAATLDAIGRVDIDQITAQLGVSRELAIEQLGDAIYSVPNSDDTWLTADDYLSGPVRKKLVIAKAAAETDARYQRNVDALTLAIPKDLNPSDVTARLGSPWIPTSDIEQFIKDTMDITTTVQHTPAVAAWDVNKWSFESRPAATSEWGTRRRHAGLLMHDALNGASPQIFDTEIVDGKDVRILNAVETEAAREKLCKIKDAFSNWIWKDEERAFRLIKVYNESYNDLAPREFDGEHLKLRGAATGIILRKHQKRGVWRIITSGSTYVAHSVGAGKAQPLDAKILTPDGWTTMGALTLGDEIISADGSITHVEAIFPQGDKDIYRVTFSDGSTTECCDDHLWLTSTYAERNAATNARRLDKTWDSGMPKVRSLKEIRATLTAPHLGAKNHSIPLVKPVDLYERHTPIAPYLLGVILGDGMVRGGYIGFSCADNDIAERCRRLLPNDLFLRNVKQSQAHRCPTYRISGQTGSTKTISIVKALKDNGLYGLYSYEKFIPAEYLTNSIANRLELLRGLMDTDGSVSKSGHSTYFHTTSPRLAAGVKELVQSLGGTVSERSKRSPRYSHKGEQRTGRQAYNLCINLPATINPFHLSRKTNKVVPKTTYQPSRYIVAVEHVGEKQAQCIRVAHPSHLYVTDNYIVTHNTFTIAAACMEQRRLGLVTKPMIVVPGHCLAQFSREFMELYPMANILVADEATFEKSKRDRFIARATTGSWDAIIITHSAFKFIPSPGDFEADMIDRQTEAIEALVTKLKAQAGGVDNTSRKKLEQRREALRRRYEALRGRKDDMVTLKEIGIDQLIVDEAQQFRKLDFSTNAGTIKGIDSSGSQRAWDLYVKSKFIATLRPTRALILASGTPITNTLAEMFTIQRYVAEDALVERDIHEFDSWRAMFGDTITELELQPGGSYKAVSRFAEFVNIPELVAMFRQFADVVQRHDLRDLIDLPAIKGGTREIVTAAATDAFKDYQEILAKRIDAIKNRHGRPEPGEDIILSVITDGRHAAIDVRLVNPDAGDEPDNKLNVLITNVHRIYTETSGNIYRDAHGNPSGRPGAAQMVFSDLGTLAIGKKRGFSAYAWIREQLIARGIPPNEIVFMQDVKRSSEKQALFNRVKTGEVRVLIGSTETMGTGVNVQKRLKALHHLDVPWIPSHIEQREGRIERQGNENEEIEIYAYATPGSMDAPMWQSLQRKATFIAAAMAGDRSVRRIEDASAQANSFAIAKAIASGNPLLMQKAGLEADIARMRPLRSAHFDDQYGLRTVIATAKDRIRIAEEALIDLRTDHERSCSTRGDDFALSAFGERFTSRSEAGKHLVARMYDLPTSESGTNVGSIGGFDLIGRARRDYQTNEIVMEYGIKLTDRDLWPGNKADNVSPVGVIRTLENMVAKVPDLIAQTQAQLDSAKRSLRDATPRVGSSFDHEAELETKVAELVHVEAELVRKSNEAEAARKAKESAKSATATDDTDVVEEPTSSDDAMPTAIAFASTHAAETEKAA